MRRVGKGKKQANGNGLNSAAYDLVHNAGQLRRRGTRQRAAVVPHSFAQAEASLARHQRRGLFHKEVVESQPRLPADFDDVFKAGGSNKGHAPATAFEQRVGADGRPASQVEKGLTPLSTALPSLQKYGV